MKDKIAELIQDNNISTSLLSDVLDTLDIKGILPHMVTRLSGGKKIIGQAYTVQWMDNRKGKSITHKQPSTWEQVRDFLVPNLGIGDGKGKVYVAGAGNLLTHSALAGGISATYFQKHLEFEGIVLGGAVRDSEVITDLSIPVFATNFVPRDTQGAYHISSVGDYCVVDDQVIFTNDWVIADSDGVIIIPEKRIEEVLKLSLEIRSKEARVINDVIANQKLPEIIDKYGTI
ncbi:RraA family protein [Methylophaga sp.]|uniref:RraA family protein n=1 Tax=Methylophaga sp. TaxID=2024840 RepID=UPI003A905BBD